MDINQVLAELDELFREHRISEIEDFLTSHIAQAVKQQDDGSIITLLNELIGHYREMGEHEKAVSYCRQLLTLLEKNELKGTVPYATSLLNVANAYRAAGLLRESMAYFLEVREIYDRNLEPSDFGYASLYNNMSLLFQAMEDYESAEDCLQRALNVATQYAEARIEVAVTYTNLAGVQLRLSQCEDAVKNLRRAFAIFEQDKDHDYHYSGALSAMGEAQYLIGNLSESAYYYQRALDEIDRTTGRNKTYELIQSNLNVVVAKMSNPPVQNREFQNGMELCEAFYREYGLPMLQTKFPEYRHVIAVGLVGEGSECFGFDDEVSRDHDFGPGFCLWLTDQVYDEIGEALQDEYDKLPDTYMGITRFTTAKAKRRVGVFRISDFYEMLIGLKDVPVTQNQWLFLEDYQLATAVNGKVFLDDLGEFSRIRRALLQYYPEEVRIKKIAREAALMAQSGQYNYSRMFGRGEKVTAAVALSEFMKHTMYMVYLLNHKYAPFYKWMHRGMEGMKIVPDIRDILTALVELPSGDDRIPQTIELIVALIIAEMKKQGLTTGQDNYLDHHTDNILHSITQKKEKDEQEESFKAALVNELVSLEWKAFDQVHNEGGRADCQDDFETFSIMRKSQYYTWNPEMLQSFIHDFHEANGHGWNLITEKYGRMMKSTAPLRYQELEASFPKISDEKCAIVEEIVGIQVDWMEDFALRYPKAAAEARAIHTSEDTPFQTSYETYLRGELLTYSDETLSLYGRFIVKLCEQNKNLAEMIMTNTAFLYGYGSLDELEQKLS